MKKLKCYDCPAVGYPISWSSLIGRTGIISGLNTYTKRYKSFWKRMVHSEDGINQVHIIYSWLEIPENECIIANGYYCPKCYNFLKILNRAK